jgi:microcystin degradation protein MlrC
VAKSAIAWKAAFGAYAARAYYTSTPGFCPSDLRQLDFRARPTPLYPLETEARWP